MKEVLIVLTKKEKCDGKSLLWWIGRFCVVENEEKKKQKKAEQGCNKSATRYSSFTGRGKK